MQKAIYSYLLLFIIRFNLTNTEEPYFLVESLEALNSIDDINDRSYRVRVYSVNQKGRSPKIELKDFLIGDRDHHASGMYSFIVQIRTAFICKPNKPPPPPNSSSYHIHINKYSFNIFWFLLSFLSFSHSSQFFHIIAVDNGALQLSPIFLGILITILILMSYVMVRTFWKRTQQQKSDDAVDSSKQSSSLLCSGVSGNGNGTANTANHTDTITKVCVAEHVILYGCLFSVAIYVGGNFMYVSILWLQTCIFILANEQFVRLGFFSLSTIHAHSNLSGRARWCVN